MWSWSPICIRLISNNDIHAVSGAEMCYEHQGSVNRIWLAMSPVLVSNLDNYELYVASDETIGDKSVRWIPAKYSLHHDLNENKQFSDFLAQFKSHGFSLFPHNSLSLKNEVSLIALRPQSPTHWLKNRKPLHFGVAEEPEVTITSYPFSFTNPILFSNFVSHGYINYTLKHENTPVAYLSDSKYLENMAGGVVQTVKSRSDKPTSIGLVVGNLRKRNGDGDLTLICGWSLISPFLNSIFDTSISLSKSQVNGHKLSFSQVPVFPLVVGNSQVRSWGTCTLINSVLVTNFHVLKPFLDKSDPKAYCTIYISQTEKFTLLSQDHVISPYPQIDLSFIMLSSEGLAKFKNMPQFVASNYKVDQSVYSVGYGLFFSQKQTSPLVAKGHISAISQLPFSINEDPIDSMIVTSAPCWNGSSGGALVNSNGQLLGIICCNAQVKVPDVAGTTQARTEKVSTFCMCIPIQLVLRCLEVSSNSTKPVLNHDITNLWTLTTTHTDIIESTPKL